MSFRAWCEIAPPDVLARMARDGTPAQREAALRNLAASAAIRARRSFVANAVRTLNLLPGELAHVAATPAHEMVTVYDVKHGSDANLPGTRRRGMTSAKSPDVAVNEAFDGADKTYHFFQEVFDRKSIDGNDMEIVSSVHYRTDLDNAFWNGSEMLYGDGSGQFFAKGSLTHALDVIGHELTHGITQYAANLEYRLQPGALNESFSDVFGSLVKQRVLGQTAAQADWLIGAGILAPGIHGSALRSLKAPGTAYQFDNQPGTMKDYMNLPDDADPAHDSGGVHINSGIPNHAFYLAATAIGGNAWEAPGRIWYDVLTHRLTPSSNFVQAARATVASAKALFGPSSQQTTAVREAWRAVGVLH